MQKLKKPAKSHKKNSEALQTRVTELEKKASEAAALSSQLADFKRVKDDLTREQTNRVQLENDKLRYQKDAEELSAKIKNNR